ncbi:hypothetical protein KEM56_003053, partial [Ascosphaera pollenicola]
MAKFVRRQRKHKVRAREEQDGAGKDTNAEQVMPVSQAEREERRKKMKEELRAEQPKMSSKKQKRLDKYIENKLKKEENLALLKKLAASKVEVSGLQSSRHLGRSKDRAFDRPKEETSGQKRPREDDYLGDSDISSDEEVAEQTTSTTTTATPAQSTSGSGLFTSVPVGGGLKRPLEIGEDDMPVIKKRKRSAKKKKISAVMLRAPPEEDDWEGFDSEDDEVEHGSSSEREMAEEAAAMEDETSSEGSGAEESSDEGESSSGEDEEESDEDEDSEEGSDQEDEDEDDDEPKKIAPRQSAFKAWAVQQINDSVGYTPAEFTPLPATNPTNKKEKPVRNTVEMNEPLPAELQIPQGNTDRKAYAVSVSRPEHIQEARLGLPVVGEEQNIMESIYNNN